MQIVTMLKSTVERLKMSRIELPSSRRSFIAELAEGIWEDYSRERQVFLGGIANEFDVTLSYGRYGDAFDGLLEHKSGAFHIYCNLTRVYDQNAPRARFTVAHELGHYFIDEHRNALAAGKPPHSSFPERLSDNPVEQEANLFASHLLMPTAEFQTALTEVPQGLQGIVDIARTFAVSIQSAALRYTAASTRPCTIVMFRDDKPPWWDISPQMKVRGFHFFKQQQGELALDSATGRAMRDDPTKLGSPHKSGTVASMWFSGRLEGIADDIVLIESAIRLRNRGVLTLLMPVDAVNPQPRHQQLLSAQPRHSTPRLAS